MSANDRQVAGDHYKSSIQHWDYVLANDLDYFQAQITKYVTRWKKKNGLVDLRKAQHFLDKYIEVAERNEMAALQTIGDSIRKECVSTREEAYEQLDLFEDEFRGYVNQDR